MSGGMGGGGREKSGRKEESMTSLRNKLKAGESLVGTILTLPCPEVAEILAAAGYDWLFLDDEHGSLTTRDIQALVRAAGPACPCLVRVPPAAGGWIERVLDTGAAGVIVPGVHSAAQALEIVSSAKYPPAGSRSLGLGRAQGYGARLEAYLESANREGVVVVQAEHRGAVKNITEIASVVGLDAVFVGPYDLSGSYGIPGRVDDLQVVAAIDRVLGACRKAGIPAGIFGIDTAAVAPYRKAGFRLLAVSSDTLMLHRAAVGQIERLRSGKDG